MISSSARDLASGLQRLQVEVKINLRIDSEKDQDSSSDMTKMEQEACEVLLLLAQSGPKLDKSDEKPDLDIADGYTSASESPDHGCMQWANGANAANALKKKSRNKRSFDIDDLRPFFNMPMATAAKKLEVCSSFLVKECRTHGIMKWPYRQIRSLEQKVACARASLSSCTDTSMRDVISLRVQRYEQTKDRLLETGSAPDESDDEGLSIKQEPRRVELPSAFSRSTSPSNPPSPYGHSTEEAEKYHIPSSWPRPEEIVRDNSDTLPGSIKRSRSGTNIPTHSVPKRTCMDNAEGPAGFDQPPGLCGSGAISRGMMPASVGMYQHQYQHAPHESLYNSMSQYPLPPHMTSHPVDPSRGPYYTLHPHAAPMGAYGFPPFDPRSMNERYMHHGMQPRFMYPHSSQDAAAAYGMHSLPPRM